jgi:hypothetical protein
MRVFLITLAASIALSIGLWNFGLARRIWPSHPLLATTLIAAGCATAVQLLLTRDEAISKKQK